MSRRLLVFVGLGLLVLAGCGRRLPSVVPVQGTVLLDGQPLPNASVAFVPMLDQFGPEANSTGVTDANGQFSLTCAYNAQPGAVIGKHVVLVGEPPLPTEMRNVRDSRVLENYRANLGNRPIPPDYNSMGKSLIQIEVKEGQSEYKIELKRQ
jgi:hypothetical protein